ncbi:MAG: carboxymuconolactone decarboxylase family protein [Trueperaceae bacterium]
MLQVKKEKHGAARAAIWGDKADKVAANLRELDSDLADLIMRVAYDEVFEREGLDLKTKELLAIAHLLSVGSESELRIHFYGALRAGSSHTELKELILHAAMFLGFPKAVAGMKVLKSMTEG